LIAALAGETARRKSVEDALFALSFATHPARTHKLRKFGKQMPTIDNVSAAHLVSFQGGQQAEGLTPAKPEDLLDRGAVDDGCREGFDRATNFFGPCVPGGRESHRREDSRVQSWRHECAVNGFGSEV
jgi:hypothetical protein